MSASFGTKTAEIVFIRKSALTVEFKLNQPIAPPERAIFMVKYNLSDPDSAALIESCIETAASPDGLIDGPETEFPILRFVIPETDTELLPLGIKLYSALKVFPVGGRPYSPRGGRRGVRVIDEGIHATA